MDQINISGTLFEAHQKFRPPGYELARDMKAPARKKPAPSKAQVQPKDTFTPSSPKPILFDLLDQLNQVMRRKN